VATTAMGYYVLLLLLKADGVHLYMCGPSLGVCMEGTSVYTECY
jgi:hypothetical protein